MSDLTIYTDGGARGNPGPAASSFVVVKSGAVVYKESKFLGKKTNNQAEYEAVILALNWLIKNSKIHENKIINFYLDSELVVRQLTGAYKIKSKTIHTLFELAKEIMSKIEGKIFFTAVKREKNKLADKLVNEKIDENV